MRIARNKPPFTPYSIVIHVESANDEDVLLRSTCILYANTSESRDPDAQVVCDMAINLRRELGK